MWASSQSWQLDTCLSGKILELWDLSVLLFVFYDHSRSFRDGQPHPTCSFITNASRVHRAIVNAAIQTVGRTKNIFNAVVLFLVRNYQCRWRHLHSYLLLYGFDEFSYLDPGFAGFRQHFGCHLEYMEHPVINRATHLDALGARLFRRRPRII